MKGLCYDSCDFYREAVSLVAGDTGHRTVGRPWLNARGLCSERSAFLTHQILRRLGYEYRDNVSECGTKPFCG